MILGGGMRTTSSLPTARMLLKCYSFPKLHTRTDIYVAHTFALQGFASMSPGLELSPMIIPEYTAVWAGMKRVPRSAKLSSAYDVETPSVCEISAPLRAVGAWTGLGKLLEHKCGCMRKG